MPALSRITNGRAAAALVAAAIGCFAMGVFTGLAELSPNFSQRITLYHPTGPLSGETTLGVVTWLGAWGVLSILWEGKDISWGGAMGAVGVLLALGFVLTFPPIFRLLGS